MAKLPSESNKDVVCCFFCHMNITNRQNLCNSLKFYVIGRLLTLFMNFPGQVFFVILLNSIVWR